MENLKVFEGILDHKISIPSYQRAYSWGEKQIEDFCKDLIDVSNKEYYYGHFIMENNNEVYEIIDGQQRITTFVLFALSVKLYLGYELDEKIKSFILNNFETIDYDQEKFNELTISILENNLLIEICEDDTSSFKRIIKTFEYFKKSFNRFKVQNIKVLINTLLKSKISTHVTNNKTIAVQIFELQNSRGIKLDIIEKVKSKLMKEIYLYSEDSEQDIKTIQKCFTNIYKLEEQTLESSFRGDLKLENILLHHLRVIDDGNKRETRDLHSPSHGNLEITLLEYISKKINDTKDSHNKVNYILNLSKLFEKSVEIICNTLVVKDKNNPLIGDTLILDRNLSIEMFLILTHSNKLETLNLKKWELFLFTRDFHGVYYKQKNRDNFQWLFSRVLKSEESTDDILTDFIKKGFRRELLNDDLQGTFKKYIIENKDKILTNAYSFWREKMTYLLYKYEISLDVLIREELRSLFKTSKSLEHIVPQTWSVEWLDESQKQDEIFKSKIISKINGIGNLLLLSSSENSSESNSHPKDKLYKISNKSSYKKHNENCESFSNKFEKWIDNIDCRGNEIYTHLINYFIENQKY